MTEKATPQQLQKYIVQCGADKMFSFDILPYVKLKTYKRGEAICRRDEPLTELMFLVEGRIKIYVLKSNGVMALSSFASAPYLIGDTEFLLPCAEPNEVEAMNTCRFLTISFVKHAELMSSDNLLYRSLAKLCAQREAATRTKISDMVAYPLKNRLAALILDSENEGYYTQRLTEASGYLNVSYRHLLHVLDAFCNENILFKERGRCYKILNRAGLEDLARPMLE